MAKGEVRKLRCRKGQGRRHPQDAMPQKKKKGGGGNTHAHHALHAASADVSTAVESLLN